jgi:hypothetical protein
MKTTCVLQSELADCDSQNYGLISQHNTLSYTEIKDTPHMRTSAF